MSFFCSNFVLIIEIMNFVANIRSLIPAEAAKQAGVAAIFGPGTSVAYSAYTVMQLLMNE